MNSEKNNLIVKNNAYIIINLDPQFWRHCCTDLYKIYLLIHHDLSLKKPQKKLFLLVTRPLRPLSPSPSLWPGHKKTLFAASLYPKLKLEGADRLNRTVRRKNFIYHSVHYNIICLNKQLCLRSWLRIKVVISKCSPAISTGYKRSQLTKTLTDLLHPE